MKTLNLKSLIIAIVVNVVMIFTLFATMFAFNAVCNESKIVSVSQLQEANTVEKAVININKVHNLRDRKHTLSADEQKAVIEYVAKAYCNEYGKSYNVDVKIDSTHSNELMVHVHYLNDKNWKNNINIVSEDNMTVAETVFNTINTVRHFDNGINGIYQYDKSENFRFTEAYMDCFNVYAGFDK